MTKRENNDRRLLKAIQRLGSTPEEIKDALVSRGFQGFDQTKETACPVCAYLLSIGFKKPKVMVDYIAVRGARVSLFNRLMESRPMRLFQQLAANGKVKGMAGCRES